MDEGVETSNPRPMRVAYRVFLLASDDSVRDSVPLTAADDAEAMALAAAMVDGQAVELWDGVRFIERFGRARR